MTLEPLTQRRAGAIEIYDNAVANHAAILDEIVSTSVEWREARIGESVRDTMIRDNYVSWINPFDFRTPPILHDFCRTVWHYIDDYGKRYKRSFTFLESVNVNRYEPGQQYHVHSDAEGSSPRVISALVYLNNDFDGGETHFTHFNESVSPQAGRLVIFPSNYAYAHAALPPSSGIKYSAAFWVNA